MNNDAQQAQQATFCCSGNCPTIRVEGDQVILTDDFEGKVQLVRSEFESIQEGNPFYINKQQDKVTLFDKSGGMVRFTPDEFNGLCQQYNEMKIAV